MNCIVFTHQIQLSKLSISY